MGWSPELVAFETIEDELPYDSEGVTFRAGRLTFAVRSCTLQLLGVGQLDPDRPWPGWWSLAGLWVLPKHRRKGIGRALVLHLMNYALQHTDKLHAAVRDAALDLFVGVGWRVHSKHNNCTWVRYDVD